MKVGNVAVWWLSISGWLPSKICGPRRTTRDRYRQRRLAACRARRDLRIRQVGAAFAASDNPVDAAEIDLAEIREQRLGGNKAHGRAGALQVLESAQDTSAFDCRPGPKVVWKLPAARKISHAIGSLGEDLVLVLRRVLEDYAR